ncbi:MAG: MBOAT family O-acyltransferase [Thermoguttaceae bacterium]
MFFNSFEYAIFLPIVVIIFWMIARFEQARTWWLIAASYYFYMCWDWRFAGLIFFTTALNYIAGHRIYASSSNRIRQIWLWISLLGSLGTLAYFKYFNFFLDSFATLAQSLGWSLVIPHLNIILPVGISFFTFQTLSYTLDIYRRQLEPTYSFPRFVLFVAFFPQLVAGPIVRAKEFLPQLDTKPVYDDHAALRGLFQIFSGLFKKVMIADVLAATLVDPVFRDPNAFSGFWLLIAVYGYAMQIYCDFSAYSDIAIGSARILGFVLPINFDRPYISASITEFWRRWHISLSTWLRDYLYIPLGGNRYGELFTYRNLLLTMLLGGLWHGAAWNFVLWGGIHGLALAFEKFFFGTRHIVKTEGLSRSLILFRQVITFHLVCFAWILFRAQATETASVMQNVWTILSRIGTWSPGISGYSSWFVFALIIGYLLHLTPPKWKPALEEWYANSNIFLQTGIACLLLLLFTFFSVGGAAFIYFQF